MISTAKLFETTWLSKYLKPTEITHDQGSEFIGYEFGKYLIEQEYRITSKPRTLVNTTSNEILKWIHQVLVNLVQNLNSIETDVEEDDPWSETLAAATFKIRSTTNRLKGYSPVNYYFSVI